MKHSEQINELSTALSKAQGEMLSAIKDSVNPHFKSKYADLNSIWDACRGPLSKNGLAVIQAMDTNDKGQVLLVTLLTHTSGQWVSSTVPVITQRQDPQAYGSALTYFKRYALSALVGISCDIDDDAESTMHQLPKLSEKYPLPPKPRIANSEILFIPISQEQWNNFTKLLSSCTPDHQDKVWSYLNSQKIACEKDIDKPLLDKLIKGINKNMSEQKENQ